MKKKVQSAKNVHAAKIRLMILKKANTNGNLPHFAIMCALFSKTVLDNYANA